MEPAHPASARPEIVDLAKIEWAETRGAACEAAGNKLAGHIAAFLKLPGEAMSTAAVAAAAREVHDQLGTTTIPIAPGTALMVELIVTVSLDVAPSALLMLIHFVGRFAVSLLLGRQVGRPSRASCKLCRAVRCARRPSLQ